MKFPFLFLGLIKKYVSREGYCCFRSMRSRESQALEGQVGRVSSASRLDCIAPKLAACSHAAYHIDLSLAITRNNIRNSVEINRKLPRVNASKTRENSANHTHNKLNKHKKLQTLKNVMP